MHKAHVYLFDDMDSLGSTFVADNIHRLPKFRQQQCAKYKQEIDKKTCVMAFLLLQEGLKQQFGVLAPPIFIYNQHGKPYLRETPQIFFSLSHCKYGVACAISHAEIGIDIQDVRPLDIRIAQKICSEKELAQVEASSNPDRMLCQVWTKKEAYAKAKGIGVASMLAQDTPSKYYKTWETSQYSMAAYSHQEYEANVCQGFKPPNTAHGNES